MRKFPATATLLALIACGFVFQLAAQAIGRTADGQTPPAALLVALFVPNVDLLVAAGAITPSTLSNGEWWRLLVATCLHGGVLHLILNAWALLQVGSAFELLFGARRLFLVYFLSAITASVASASYIDVKAAVGASGAIFGLFGALLVMLGAGPHRGRWAGDLRLRLGGWAATVMIAGFFADRIDNASHVGGFIAGLVLGSTLRAAMAARPRSPSTPSTAPPKS
jgi:membrane associated rhomboid family serine protease